MRCDLICGRCRRRWFYEGDDPFQGLVDHRRSAHPDEDTGLSPLDPAAAAEREPSEGTP